MWMIFAEKMGIDECVQIVPLSEFIGHPNPNIVAAIARNYTSQQIKERLEEGDFRKEILEKQQQERGKYQDWMVGQDPGIAGALHLKLPRDEQELENLINMLRDNGAGKFYSIDAEKIGFLQ